MWASATFTDEHVWAQSLIATTAAASVCYLNVAQDRAVRCVNGDGAYGWVRM